MGLGSFLVRYLADQAGFVLSGFSLYLVAGVWGGLMMFWFGCLGRFGLDVFLCFLIWVGVWISWLCDYESWVLLCRVMFDL